MRQGWAGNRSTSSGDQLPEADRGTAEPNSTEITMAGGAGGEHPSAERAAADMAFGERIHTHSELLRLALVGSVDDGKSTLIGRLLYDTQQILEDQLESLERSSRRRGDDALNLALLTDGLRAEREQGITIDVAYRYFTTPRRTFILADTPGHVQYTRNMVTGASTADLVLILIDARNGMTQQSRRHALIASLLRVRHFVVCINKMDLVGYDEGVFEQIKEDFAGFAAKLEVPDSTFIPISALHGDNVASLSDRMPWYQGPPLLHHLDTVYVASDRNLIDRRFPVQWIIRPSGAASDYRGYAGQICGGVWKPGDEVVVLPSDLPTRIVAIDTFNGPLEEAFPPMAVTLRLADDLDVARGDMICRDTNRPQVGQRVDAMVCWMTERPLAPGNRYAVKHTTRTVKAVASELLYRLDIDSLHRDESTTRLGLNEIGRVSIRTTAPLFYDEYRRNRTTGSFVVIDESTNATVGAGMIVGPTS